MVQLSATQILAKYFNEGEGKVGLREFQAELKALSAEEKEELAILAAPLVNATLKKG